LSITDKRASARTIDPAQEPTADELQGLWSKVVGRRSFLRQAGLASAAAVPAAAIATSVASAKPHLADEPTEGDFAILRFLCAAEILESDLWEQYRGFGGVDGANPAYIAALENLDSDMPQYVADNTDDEESHQAFINAYLMSKGQKPVSLEHFRGLDPSPATGGGSRKRLTNLMALNVDTSFYLRYRATTNPDFGAKFGQAVTIAKQPAIPISDTDTPPNTMVPGVPVTPTQNRIQAIANTAGFHFAMIEQGGSSLYTTMALNVTSVEVLRIVVAIGGVETNHFSLWHDKCGNAVSPPLGGAVTDPETKLFFPNLNEQNSEATQANLILPEPCEFIPGLPDCSVVRPTLDKFAGAQAAVKGLTADGLFNGQSAGFFTEVTKLAKAADAAQRGF
jgi:ferritin-like protein